jgi:hypothetical protein
MNCLARHLYAPIKSYLATIVRKIQDLDAENHAYIKFLVELGDGAFDEKIAYGTLCACIEELEDEDLISEQKLWLFTDFIGYQRTLRKSLKDWIGSLYNVLLLWEDGSDTYEPLEMIIKDDLVTLASYALNHDLFGRPGWKKVRPISTKLHHEQRALSDFSIEVLASKQAKGPVFQLGVQVPCNVKESYDLDKQNGNTNWQDAIHEEIDSPLAYSNFNDEGHIKFLPGYKEQFNMTYVIKLVLWLVVISLIPKPLTANIPVFSQSVAFESISLLGSSTTCS